MALHRIAIKTFIGIDIVPDSIQNERGVIDPVTVTSDDRSEEPVTVFKQSKFSGAYDDVIHHPVPPRHTDFHYPASIICQGH